MGSSLSTQFHDHLWWFRAHQPPQAEMNGMNASLDRKTSQSEVRSTHDHPAPAVKSKVGFTRLRSGHQECPAPPVVIYKVAQLVNNYLLNEHRQTADSFVCASGASMAGRARGEPGQPPKGGNTVLYPRFLPASPHVARPCKAIDGREGPGRRPLYRDRLQAGRSFETQGAGQ